MSEPEVMPAPTGGPEEDPDHHWRAADELLTALAVDSASHEHLTVTRRAWGRLCRLGGVEQGSAGEAAEPGGGVASGDSPATPSWTERERTEVNDAIDSLAASALPLAAEALGRLDVEQIRPELAGMSRMGLATTLTTLEQTHREGAWRTASEEEDAGRRNCPRHSC